MLDLVKKFYNFTVYFQPLAEGGYNVMVPAFPEICTFGSNLDDARESAKEAIECILESNLKRKESLFNKNFDFVRQEIQIPLKEANV